MPGYSRVHCFGAALHGIRRLPLEADPNTRQRFGILKTSVLSFHTIFRSLLPVIEVVFYRMCDLHYLHHRDEGWDQYWKGVSREGYEIIRGRILVYGNREGKWTQ